MVHENIDLSRLMVHAQQVEESHLRKMNREAKRAESFESYSSKSRLDVQDKSMFKKRFLNQVPSYFSKIAMIEVLILNLKTGEMLIHQEKDQLMICG